MFTPPEIRKRGCGVSILPLAFEHTHSRRMGWQTRSTSLTSFSKRRRRQGHRPIASWKTAQMELEPSSSNRLPLLVTFAIAAFVVAAVYLKLPNDNETSPAPPPGSTNTAQASPTDDGQPAATTVKLLHARLARLEVDKAENAFANGDTSTAFAYLARVIRRDPHNRMAVRRLLFALTYRSLALPARPPLEHDAAVSCARYSSDGTHIVTASSDGVVRVWNAANSTLKGLPVKLGSPVLWADFDPSGTRIVAGTVEGSAWLIDVDGPGEPKPLRLSQKPVFHVEFNSTGLLALTASRDNTIAIWNATNGEPIAKLAQHEGALRFARFSPDGKRILTGDANGVSFIWNVESGEVETGPMTFPGSVNEGRFSPDGASLALALSDGTVQILETLTGLLHCAPIQHANSVVALAYSPDGLTLATASKGDGKIQLFDSTDGSLVSGPVTALGTAQILQFSPGGLRLASASTSGAIQIWDGLELLPLNEPLLFNAPIGNLQFSPDGARLLQTASQSSPQIWDVRLSGALPLEFTHDAIISASAFNSTGNRLATATSDGEVRLWDFSTGREIWTKRHHEQPIVSIHFPTEDKHLITVGADGSVADLDTETGELSTPLMSLGAPTTHAFFGPNGWRIAALSPSGVLKIWSLESGKLTPGLPESENMEIFHARFSPDGAGLATANENQVQLWNLSNDVRIGPTLDFAGIINAIEYAGAGERIVVGLDDGSARIYEVATGKQVGPIMLHNEAVWRIRVSRDGRMAATSSDDRTVRIWDTATALPITSPLLHESLPWSFDFNADGSLLFTGTVGGRIRAWDVKSGQALSASLSHGEPVEIVRFHPSRNLAIVGGGSPTLRGWSIPDVVAPAPAWLPELAEAIGGKKLNERNLLEAAPTDVLAGLHKQAQTSPEPGKNVFTSLSNWLFADSLTRAARPDSQRSVRDEISGWLALDDPSRLRQFALRNPSEPRVWNRIAELLSAPEGDETARAANALVAAFCRQRARQLGGVAPADSGPAQNVSTSAASDSTPTASVAQPQNTARARTPDSAAALYFDGRTSRISASNIPFDEYETFTIEAWVQQWRNHVVSQGVFDPEENGIWLTLGAAGSENPRWTCGWRSGAGTNWDYPVSADHPSAWQHLALTFDGHQLSIYLNGKLRHSTDAPIPGPLQKNRSLIIGAHEWTDRLTFGTGFLRNLRVSRTLRYRGDFVPDPILKADRRTVLLYDFSIDPGLRAVDRSGNERHGTIRGAIWSEGQ